MKKTSLEQVNRLISRLWYAMMNMVKFGASLRRAEGEEGHPLAFLLPFFYFPLSSIFPSLQN